jgi:hypothetical protein
VGEESTLPEGIDWEGWVVGEKEGVREGKGVTEGEREADALLKSEGEVEGEREEVLLAQGEALLEMEGVRALDRVPTMF